MTPASIQRNYLILVLLNTLAGSFIWGINTLFLLGAGLSNTEAFTANAFFSVGVLLFEIPTGVVADTWGRRASYLMGLVVLTVFTTLYLLLGTWHFAFWGWALVSLMLGMGFTFFSGAVDAWFVDALKAVGYEGSLEDVFAKSQIVVGASMLTGTILGGFIAQFYGIGIPYIMRISFFVISFVFAFFMMKDVGFTPQKMGSVRTRMKTILKNSIDGGIRFPAVRWVMVMSPFISGASFYSFYAAQPYLLELFGSKGAFGVAGLAAALVAGSQIVGGISVHVIRKPFKKRTTLLGTLGVGAGVMLILLGVTTHFWIALVMIAGWGLVTAAMSPVKQAYLNKCIKSDQRATILSFDGLMGSVGSAGFQPLLARSADMWSYSVSLMIAGILQFFVLPFAVLAARGRHQADVIKHDEDPPALHRA